MRTEIHIKKSEKTGAGAIILKVSLMVIFMFLFGVLLVGSFTNMTTLDPEWEFCHSPEISLKTIDQLPVKCLWYYTR